MPPSGKPVQMPRLVVRPWAWPLDRPGLPKNAISAKALCNQALTRFPSACLKNMTGKLPLFRAKLVGSRWREATCGTNLAPFKAQKTRELLAVLQYLNNRTADMHGGSIQASLCECSTLMEGASCDAPEACLTAPLHLFYSKLCEEYESRCLHSEVCSSR